MLFTELRFLPFFLVAFAVHWLLPAQAARKVWLLGCSYLFYGAWDPRFLLLLFASTALDYAAGLGIHRARARSRRRAWLLLSVIGNLGILGFFKYWDFFLVSAREFLGWLGFSADLPVLGLILPVGISFFTFQTMSYSLDIYFGRLQPTRSFLDLALFVAFFPQLVAGPIVRAADFLPQLAVKARLAQVPWRPALLLFLSGYVKKTCIADNLALAVVDPYFADPGAYDLSSAWLAILGYAVQIYCDFSGYSDMAIACARLLGYELCRNFYFPYFAADIREFWRRWHISLSTWLRDYLYVPLGGNRGSQRRTQINLMLTMLLGGLWHGAAWNFVIWGGLHGLALVVQRAWSTRVRVAERWRAPWRVASWLFTFWFVCLCWIFFRARGSAATGTVLEAFLLGRAGGGQAFDPLLWWLAPLLLAAHAVARSGRLARLWIRLPGPLYAASLGAACAAALAFTPVSRQPFIYFQF